MNAARPQEERPCQTSTTAPASFPTSGPTFPSRNRPRVPSPAWRISWAGSGWDRLRRNGRRDPRQEWIRWAVEGWVLYSIQVTEAQGQPPTLGYGLMTQDPCTNLLVMTKIAQESVATGTEDPRLTGEPKTVVFVGNTDACTSSLAWRQHLTQVAENKMSTLTG